ncbi:hypothetical protein ACMD2_08439 [Ananas comosus]|uniref:Secreted protein n=1 Tax=Ananas comosus TaxID=4615 RepID=A0A199VNJ9_ANACO|nr:hypothetical protein ACMD2_08439 [Ananas comosus]
MTVFSWRVKGFLSSLTLSSAAVHVFTKKNPRSPADTFREGMIPTKDWMRNNLSTLSFIWRDKNFMQIGGCTFASASTDCGSVHSPSPQISPDATAGPNASAFALSTISHTNSIRLPTHMSIAKYDPM